MEVEHTIHGVMWKTIATHSGVDIYRDGKYVWTMYDDERPRPPSMWIEEGLRWILEQPENI